MLTDVKFSIDNEDFISKWNLIGLEFSPSSKYGIARAEPDGTCAETRFRLSPKRTSPFKSVGASVQSTAGSRGVCISFSNAGYTTFGGGVRVLATHSIRQFPLHFPSCASPCATRFRTSSTERNHWAFIGIIIGNGKAVSVLYELRVTEAYGWTIGIALPTLNEPVYYSLLKVQLLCASESKTALYIG